jgi:hypothetical protein
MAQLDIQLKKSSPISLWLMLPLLAIITLAFISSRWHNQTVPVVTVHATAPQNKVVKQPAWLHVDFLSPSLIDIN